MRDFETHMAHVNGPKRRKRISHKGVAGVGTNDVDWRISWVEGGKLLSRDPAYDPWQTMHHRCEIGGRDQQKFPTYKGCSVDPRWDLYSEFTLWWRIHQRDGWQLDKDLLFAGNKVYGPDTCVVVPDWLNSFTTAHGAARGNWPIGVSASGSKFAAHVRNVGTKIKEYLGAFHTPEAAHTAWENRKLEMALERKAEMDAIDPRIYWTVVKIIQST